MNLDRAIEAATEALRQCEDWTYPPYWYATIAVETAAPYISSDPTSWIDIHNRAEDWKDRAERAEAEVRNLTEMVERNTGGCEAWWDAMKRAVRAEALADQLYGLVSDMQCDCLPYAVRGDGMCERCDALAAWEEARRDK